MNASDLATFEALSEKLYTSNQAQDREQAGRLLHLFVQPPAKLDFSLLTQAQFVLDHSSSRYALVLAATALSKVIGDHWLALPSQTRLGLRTYLLNLMGTKGTTLDDFVAIALVKLVCLVLKLSWMENAEQTKEIMQRLGQFLQVSVPHCHLGLRILGHLVEEMNNARSGGLTPTMHRKICISFRDTSLLDIFQLSLTTLRQLFSKPGGAEEEKLKELALSLSLRCLSFDFIGTTPDESASDVYTVQAPSSWRTVLYEPATLRLFVDSYCASRPPVSTNAMGCLVQMASVRRTLFLSEDERHTYLANLMQMTIDVLKNKTGLEQVDNHHEFSRLLYRFKSNYQLTQLVAVNDKYSEWITLVAEFTCATFKEWQTVPHSGHNLLLMWSRLVSSMTYMKTDIPTLLDSLTPRVMEAYVNSMLNDIDEDGTDEDDPLRNIEPIQEELEALPYLGRCNYATTSSHIVSLFDPRAQAYQQSTQPPSPSGSLLEGQLAWMVYVMGAVIGARIGFTPVQTEEHDAIDGELSYRVFQLMQLHDQRLMQSAPGRGGDPRLESALLFFVSQFRKMYVSEQAMSTNSRLYARLAERIGIADDAMVMNMIITKIVRNLKFWASDIGIVTKSLTLFNELASGYSSSKIMCKMDVVVEILEHHTSQHFPFLDVDGNVRNRTTFYSTLSKMLFMEPHTVRFASFMQPFKNQLVALQSMHPEALRQENYKRVLIFLLRDLLGVLTSIQGRRGYTLFFEWIYPEHTPLLVRAAEVWADTPAITSPLLKLFSELVHNKSGRISFPVSSPDGYLLFRETSKLLVAYGQRLVRHTPADPKDPYADKYKGIWQCMVVLTRALLGNYVNFGVFALYGDPALSNALQVVLQLVLSIPFPELTAYPKVVRAYYAFISTLCQMHTSALLELDTPVFVQILSSLKEGLSSLTTITSVSSQSCDALDHIFTFVVENKTKDIPAMRSFAAHTASHAEMLPQMLELLFQALLFEDNANQWAVSRPLFSLLLLIPTHFSMLRDQFVASQMSGDADGEKRQKLVEAFGKLMTDVKDNLMPKNREKFTQNATVFKNEVKALLV